MNRFPRSQVLEKAYASVTASMCTVIFCDATCVQPFPHMPILHHSTPRQFMEADGGKARTGAKLDIARRMGESETKVRTRVSGSILKIIC